MGTVEEVRGIASLKVRDPVGVAVSLGVKDARGIPREKDHLHLVTSRNIEGRRPHHPSYTVWNLGCPPETKPHEREAWLAKRRTLRGLLMSPHENQCYEYKLRAQALGEPWQLHPKKKPACVGDGKNALRFMGGDENNYKEIICPDEKCEFRLQVGKKPAACRPFVRLVFLLTWPEEFGGRYPTMTAKFTSRGIATVSNIVGCFEMIKRIAAQNGIHNPNLTGLPIILMWQQGTNPQLKARYPIVTMSPETDLIKFFSEQKSRIKELENAATIEDIQDSTVEDIEDLQPGFGGKAP